MATTPEAPGAPTTQPTRLWPTYAAAGLFALAITIGILFIPIDYKAFGNYGYLGVFLITLVSTAGLIIPVPYLAAVIVAGTYLDPLLVGLVAGLASTFGELTGYMLGFSGRGIAGKVALYQTAERWMRRYGFLTVLVFSIIPNPFFDAAGLAAGTLKMPVAHFMLACFIGKTVRLILIAYLGFVLPPWMGGVPDRMAALWPLP